MQERETKNRKEKRGVTEAAARSWLAPLLDTACDRLAFVLGNLFDLALERSCSSNSDYGRKGGPKKIHEEKGREQEEKKKKRKEDGDAEREKKREGQQKKGGPKIREEEGKRGRIKKGVERKENQREKGQKNG